MKFLPPWEGPRWWQWLSASIVGLIGGLALLWVLISNSQ